MINQSFFLPAEWHEQSQVQLTWPHEGTDWAPYLDEITSTMCEIASAITHHENIVIATQDKKATLASLNAALTPLQMERVKMVICPTNDTWARDHGGITLISNDGEKRILNFRFNGWGEKFPADRDNLITPRLHAAGMIKGTLINNDDLVLEGGSIESDGKGTIFTTSQCLMAPHRNQPLSQNELEEQLLRRLCAKRIVWLSHGTLIGDDTDGHIDTTVRICPDDTLLYCRCTPEDTEQYDDFMKLEEELRQLRTLEGKPYRLVPLPVPRAIHYDDERLPATYANFLILNGAVLVPTYGQPDLDKEAIDTIQGVFPDREVIAIDSQVIVRQHGSIHCLTMQYPV